jgi:hypothetical protein
MGRRIPKRCAHKHALIFHPSIRGTLNSGQIIISNSLNLEILGGRKKPEGYYWEKRGSPRWEDEDE